LTIALYMVEGPEFCQRLRDVLERFRKHNIFLASKMQIWMAMVEYCGNEISEEGLSMSAKKDPKVLTS
jgi:hypothetical protein